MPPADPDYLDPAVPKGMLRRSAAELNSAYDQGVDPYTGKGINASVISARNNAKMMENLIPSYGVGGMGSVLPQDQGRAVALRTGSGSPYDDPIQGGVHYHVPRSMSGSVFGGRVSKGDLQTIQAPARAKRKQDLQGAAYDSEMFAREQIGRYNAMVKRAGPDAANLFNRLSSTEQASILSKTPEDQDATLKSHPLRNTAFPPMGNPASPARAQPTMFPTITPRGIGGVRPDATLSESTPEANPVEGDYYSLAGDLAA